MNKKTNPKPKRKEEIQLDWNLCAQYHHHFIQWSLSGGATQEDLHKFAVYADPVTQSYFHGLRKVLPPLSKQKLPTHYFERLLLAHAARLNNMLCDLAKEGRPGACVELWKQALKLCDTFSELAVKNPEPFKSEARRSLFMPSIRAKNPKFTADAKAIADAIELSAETVGENLEDNRKRIGALTARLVGECVHEIKLSRSLWLSHYSWYKLPAIWPTCGQIKPFLNKSFDELIAGGRGKVGREKNDAEKMESQLRFFSMFADCGVERLHFLLLPELTVTTAPAWWKGAIEKMIDAKFPELLKQPHWEKELKSVSKGTVADMRKELKDYCVGKVKQFAPRQPRQ